ncbi:hypothetical protein Tco_0346926 [Tanacetum coccineum]
MEDEFYYLTVKGNDLKTYVRRFQELATLSPTMVPDSEKIIEEEAINIAQRLMDQVTKHTLRCKYQVITNESLTTEELLTTTTTATIITTTTVTPTPTTMPSEEPTC